MGVSLRAGLPTFILEFEIECFHSLDARPIANLELNSIKRKALKQWSLWLDIILTHDITVKGLKIR